MNRFCSAFARPAAIVILAASAALLPQLVVAQGDPLVGTWNLVPDRSTSTSGPVRYKSATLTVPAGGAEMNLEGVDAQDRPVKGTYQAIPDGKPHPITGITGVDAGTWTKNNETNTSYRYTRGRGAIVALGTRVLSTDGLTLVFREQQYDAMGRPTGTTTLTFEKPGAAEARDAAAKAQMASLQAAAQAKAEAEAAARGPSEDEKAAAAALAGGNDDQAIALFTKVIEGDKLNPRMAYSHVSRGLAYTRKGQHEQAIADFDAALKIEPNNVDARFRRGSSYAQLKNYQATIDDMTAVIAADASNAVAYRLRGFSYTLIGNYAAAATDNEKACMLNKDLCMQ